jgi:hypothetical protein
MMRKRLKRVLDRLRARTSDTHREKTSARDGLQEPQRMHGHGRS